MFILIFAIIGIGAMSLALIHTASYVNPEGVVANQMRDRIVAGFEDLEAGYKAYRNANPKRPPPTLLSQVAPQFVFVPPNIGSASWSYGTAGARRYFCLSGVVRPPVASGFQQAGQSLAGDVVIAPSCGATGSSGLVASNGTYKGAITLWVNLGLPPEGGEGESG